MPHQFTGVTGAWEEAEAPRRRPTHSPTTPYNAANACADAGAVADVDGDGDGTVNAMPGVTAAEGETASPASGGGGLPQVLYVGSAKAKRSELAGRGPAGCGEEAAVQVRRTPFEKRLLRAMMEEQVRCWVMAVGQRGQAGGRRGEAVVGQLLWWWSGGRHYAAGAGTVLWRWRMEGEISRVGLRARREPCVRGVGRTPSFRLVPFWLPLLSPAIPQTDVFVRRATLMPSRAARAVVFRDADPAPAHTVAPAPPSVVPAAVTEDAASTAAELSAAVPESTGPAGAAPKARASRKGTGLSGGSSGNTASASGAGVGPAAKKRGAGSAAAPSAVTARLTRASAASARRVSTIGGLVL
jgi:hypothetical protein